MPDDPGGADSRAASGKGRARRRLIVAPFHPIFVHFSIALTAASFAFDLAAVVFGQASLAAAGWWTLAASTLATPGTIVTGIISRVRLPMDEGTARSYLRAHMALGPVFLGILLAMTAWRAAIWERGVAPPWIYLAAMGGTICIMTVQGYLGGELVYRFGAEVEGRFTPLATEPLPVGVTAPAAGRSSEDPDS